MSIQEMVPIVDELNNIVAVLPRKKVRTENWRHRATFIFVFIGSENEQVKQKQKLIVQKRTDTKDYCPGHWDACTGGVIQEGEEYHESAKRELEEELGIADADMFHMFDFLYEDDTTKVDALVPAYARPMAFFIVEIRGVWGAAYGHHFKGDITSLRLQPEEVAAVEVMAIGEILERATRGEAFTPDSTFAVRRYCESS